MRARRRSIGVAVAAGSGPRVSGAGNDPEHLRLVRVAPARRLEPAAAAVMVATMVLGLAVWKPWAGPAPRVAAVAQTSAAPAPASDSVSQLTLRDSGMGSTAPVAFVPSSIPIVGGLRWPAALALDPHATWGVAVGMLSERRISLAVLEGWRAVAPTTRWTAADPGSPGPGPTVGDATSVAVALALTWPAGSPARSVQLLELTPQTTSMRGSAVSGRAVLRAMPLEMAIPALVRPSPGSGSRHGSASAWLPWADISGTFFLPATSSASTPIGWLSHGWPPGAYLYRVVSTDGSVAEIPFVLAGPARLAATAIDTARSGAAPGS
jgi:hypothetical protein